MNNQDFGIISDFCRNLPTPHPGDIVYIYKVWLYVNALCCRLGLAARRPQSFTHRNIVDGT